MGSKYAGPIRFFWSMSAQILSSVSSLILSALVARALSADDFGVFAILFTVYALLIGSIRAVTAETYIYAFAHVEDRTTSGDMSAASSASLALSVMAALVTVIVAFFIPNLTSTLLIFAAAIPFLVAHDHFRYILIANKQSRSAALIDLLALVAVVGGLLLVAREPSIVTQIAAWAISEVLATAAALALLRPRYRLSSAASWLKERMASGRFFLGDFLLTNGVTQGATFVVAAFAGLPAAGSIRAAQVLASPILLITRGVTVAIAPETRRLAAKGKHKMLLIMSMLFSFCTVVAVLAALGLVAVAPPEFLVMILGDSSEGAQLVFPFVALALACTGAAVGPGLYLRAVGKVNVAFRSKAMTAPLAIVGVAFGAMTGGAVGSQLGLSIGEFIRSILNWVQVLLYQKRNTNGGDQEGA